MDSIPSDDEMLRYWTKKWQRADEEVSPLSDRHANNKLRYNPSQHLEEIVPIEIRTLPTFPYNNEDRSQRWCYSCKVFLDVHAFRKGYGTCKQCRRLPPNKQRDTNYRQNYGITLEHYNRLLVSQGGVCAICGQPETRKLRGKVIPLAIDHCHKTNRVRSLLCTACNIALGMMNECPERVEKLLEYTRKWQGS